MRKHSFTLIEMLIVVVIIGILAAALIPRLQSVQARARDTKRKADLHQIATALEIYKEDHGTYDSIARTPSDDFAYIFGNSTCVTFNRDILKHDLYSTFYSTWDQFAHADRAYSILQNYMTAIPTDSNTNGWNSFVDIQRHGYLLVLMNRNQPDDGSWTTPLNSFVLAARTESEGSSSNRVTDTSAAISNATRSDFNPTTLTHGDDRQGGLSAFGGDGMTEVKGALYEKYLCSTVTLDSSTTNNGEGICTARRDGDDLRYLYIN